MVVMLLCILMPLALIFSACGATPTNEANAVNFVSDKYDDNGMAIFEVDFMVPTKLTYKVNPSSWSGYVVDYANDSTSANRWFFDFSVEDGVICVKNYNFSEIHVTITINQHSDTCLVRLKEYPQSVYAEKMDINLISQGSYTIPIYGIFDGEETPKLLSEGDYKFNVISGDITKIEVPNSNRLKIVAKGYYASTVEVTVQLLDSAGAKKFEVKLNVSIVESAKTIAVKVGGQDKFYFDDAVIEIIPGVGEGQHTFNFHVQIFGSDGTPLDSFADFKLGFSNPSVMTGSISENGAGSVTVPATESSDFKLTIFANGLTGENGEAISISLTFKIVITSH